MNEREFLNKTYFDNVIFTNFKKPRKASKMTMEKQVKDRDPNNVVVDFTLYSWLYDRNAS